MNLCLSIQLTKYLDPWGCSITPGLSLKNVLVGNQVLYAHDFHLSFIISIIISYILGLRW